MLTSQYCYFALKSITVTADDVAEWLGMRPDEIMVMGSKDPERNVPPVHAWKIVCRSAEDVDQQIEHIVGRLAPVREGLVALVAESDVSPVMQVVRYFNDDDVQARHDHDRQPSLGWNVSLEVLDFLTSTRTVLDVDEYDLSGA